MTMSYSSPRCFPPRALRQSAKIQVVRGHISFILLAAFVLSACSGTECFVTNQYGSTRRYEGAFAPRDTPTLMTKQHKQKVALAHFMSLSSDASKDVPDYVTSPVLQQVYPDLLENQAKYGHPNIPLGTESGRKCKTLRRLAFQNKLSQQEIELLESIDFRFNSLEDVYEEADFDDCLARLMEYERINKTGYQIPKKYKEDPELGAWVTMIRRIGRDNIDPERRERLDEIGFAWISTRKCGSSFMKNYRPIRDLLAEQREYGIDVVLSNETMYKWLKAQAEANRKGNLSKDRVDYLDKLSGLDWKNI